MMARIRIAEILEELFGPAMTGSSNFYVTSHTTGQKCTELLIG
jgi:hypothetical protein